MKTGNTGVAGLEQSSYLSYSKSSKVNQRERKREPVPSNSNKKYTTRTSYSNDKADVSQSIYHIWFFRTFCLWSDQVIQHFYLILYSNFNLKNSKLYSLMPQHCSTKMSQSQPTSPSQWEMLTGCDVSVTRAEVERLRFANTHIYTLIIPPSNHLTISPSHHFII